MMTKIRYLMDVYPDTVFSSAPVMGHRGNDVTGYGRKIRTDTMARFNNRDHRVYVICYSNCGSSYVLCGGESLYLRDYDLQRIEVNA